MAKMTPADGKNLSQNNKKTKNLAKKYYIRLRKFKNIESPIGVKTAQRPLFKVLWAILEKNPILIAILKQKVSAKIGITWYF